MPGSARQIAGRRRDGYAVLGFAKRTFGRSTGGDVKPVGAACAGHLFLLRWRDKADVGSGAPAAVVS